MSYQERNHTVSFISNLLIFGYYFLNVFQMNQAGDLDSTAIFSLWATVIVLGILASILSSILTAIASNIISMIKTNTEEPTIADERDKLIELKGTRNTYYVFSVGVFIAMASLVLAMPPLVMFNLLIFSAISSQIVGDLSRIYLYRRGF